MQTANDIFIAQQNACANAGEQRRNHEGMPGMIQNDHRAKDHHTGTGDARQKADQHHQRGLRKAGHRQNQPCGSERGR